jgi:hypothetical protein
MRAGSTLVQGEKVVGVYTAPVEDRGSSCGPAACGVSRATGSTEWTSTQVLVSLSHLWERSTSSRYVFTGEFDTFKC